MKEINILDKNQNSQLSNLKKTLILGASPNPERYSYLATSRLNKHGIASVPVGIRQGEIDGISIIKGTPDVEGIHTVTLYIGPKRQPQYYEYILGLNPKRIIFNPGTENPELMKLAAANGVETVVACTLVMLSLDNY